MSTFPKLTEVVANALNRTNATTAIDPAEIRLVRTVAADAAAESIDVTVTGSANKPKYGEYTVRIRRIPLTEFFGPTRVSIPSSLVAPRVATVKELLKYIAFRYGITIPDGVIIDESITWQDDAATVTLTAVADNVYVYGSVRLTLTYGVNDIATLLNRNYFTIPTKSMTREQLITNIEAANNCPLQRDYFEFGPLQSVAEAGVTLGNWNSVIRVTPRRESGYVGTYDVFTNRFDLSTVKGPLYVPDDFSGTLYDALEFENINIRNNVDITELADAQIDYSQSPIRVTIQPKPDSLRVFNSVTVDIMRFSDDEKETVIDFTVNRTTMLATTLSDLIRAKVPKAARLLVTVNVAPDVYLVGSTVKDYGLTIPYMSQYSEVVLTLNNRGFITGRGAQGSDTGWANAAGNGLFIDPKFKGSVAINNLGTIAGGGGGGGMSSALYYVGGGGGQPLGAASNTKDSGSFYAGPAATLTAPGASREVWRSDTLYYFGGAGGGLGQPGKIPGQRSGNPPLYSKNQTTPPSDPGQAVVDASNIALWLQRGTIMPPIVNQQTLLDQWMDEQLSAIPVTDTTELDLLDADGKFIVSLDSKTDYYTDRENWTLASKLQCIGQVWGQPVGKVFYTRIPGMLQLGMENENVFYYNYRKNNRIYFELESTTTRIATPIIYRNFTSGQALTIAQEQVRLKRIVYYDPWRGYVVDVNPYLKTIKQFEGFTTNLSRTLNELDGFKK